MSTDSMNQFLRFTVAGAYSQALEQATNSERLAGSAPRSSNLRSAAYSRPDRVGLVGRQAKERGWVLGFGLGVIALGIGLFSL
jgi:hypothetical protein